MIPSVLALQLKHGVQDFLRTTFPILVYPMNALAILLSSYKGRRWCTDTWIGARKSLP